MASKYYIINSSSYADVEDNLEGLTHWNVSGSQCIVEVNSSYVVNGYLNEFLTSNTCQDYIHDPIRENEWVVVDPSETP